MSQVDQDIQGTAQTIVCTKKGGGTMELDVSRLGGRAVVTRRKMESVVITIDGEVIAVVDVSRISGSKVRLACRGIDCVGFSRSVS